MPNWCITNITIAGQADDIKKLYKDIWEATSMVRSGSDFGKDWEGNILAYFGIDHNDEIRCRGYITDLDVNVEEHGDATETGCITISQEDAWSPNVGYIKLIIDKKYPSLNDGISFIAEEPGCELYVKFGDYYKDKAFVDLCINGDYESEYFDSVEGAIDYVNEATGMKFSSPDEVNNKFISNNLEDYVNLHTYDEDPCDLFDYVCHDVCN